MGLIATAEDIRAIAEVVRPLVNVTKRHIKFDYNSLCLRVTLNGDCQYDKHVMWSNMLYRAFYLFEEFDNDMGRDASTTGYEASMSLTEKFAVIIDKPTPDHKSTMTTGSEGPYTVNLQRGDCQCRYFAGHPYVIRGEQNEIVIVGSEIERREGFSKFQISNWRILEDWFPELDWKRHTCETGTDPCVDCKHLVAAHLNLLACLAEREGLTAKLPEETKVYVDRQIGHARYFGLFPALK